MKDLFKDILSADESLFLNEVVLSYDYVPKNIQFRENEQHYIASCIKPLLQKRNGKNLLIYGSPGIGKTLAAKQVLKELEEQNLDEQAYPIYINCWKKDTSHKIALEVCSQINYKWVHNKNTDELIKEITDIINKSSAIFVLDEFDKLSDQSIIYSLLEDIYRKTIILITNEKDLINLEPRLRSRLILENLEFRPYNLEETKNILKFRKEYAFVKDIWTKEAFDLIAEKTFELKDIRTGLFLLKEVGLIAENKSSRSILLEHAQEALSKLNNYHVKNSKDFDNEEKFILNLIKENSGKTSGEIYEKYKTEFDKSYRTFSRKIEDFKKNNLVTTEDIITEKGGKTSKLYYSSIKKLTEF